MIGVLDAARVFLSLGSMQHKKLQKLCYYAQAYYLALTGTRLINTHFEAWVHGPVSPELYVRYKEWGALFIPQTPFDAGKLDAQTVCFLRAVFHTYKDYSADEMEQLTHQEKPWIEARQGAEPTEMCRTIINDSTMQDFYGGLLHHG